MVSTPCIQYLNQAADDSIASSTNLLEISTISSEIGELLSLPVPQPRRIKQDISSKLNSCAIQHDCTNLTVDTSENSVNGSGTATSEVSPLTVSSCSSTGSLLVTPLANECQRHYRYRYSATATVTETIDPQIHPTAKSAKSSDNSKSADTGLSRADKLKKKRLAIEEWHSQRKLHSRSTMAGLRRYHQTAVGPTIHGDEFDATSPRPGIVPSPRDLSRSFSPTGSQPKSRTVSCPTAPRAQAREERQRIKRIIQRLEKALHILRVKYCDYGIRSDRMVDPRRKHQALKERAATKLRITQVEQAMKFYQHRLDSRKKGSSELIAAVPAHIIRTVSSLNTLSKHTLKDDLEHALASWSEQQGPVLVEALPKLRQLQHSGIERYQPSFQIGDLISLDTILAANTSVVIGKHVQNGTKLKGHPKCHRNGSPSFRRLILVVYQGGWSPLCVATLRFWQSIYKSHIESTLNSSQNDSEGRGEPDPPLQLVGVGMESLASCKGTALRSSLKFPLIPDKSGSLLLNQLGLLVENHPLHALNPYAVREASTALPLVATLILDYTPSGLGKLVHSHVSVDPTLGSEPLETVQVALSLPPSDFHMPTKSSPSGGVGKPGADASSIGTAKTISTSAEELAEVEKTKDQRMRPRFALRRNWRLPR